MEADEVFVKSEDLEGTGEDDNLKEEEMVVLDREGVNENFKEELNRFAGKGGELEVKSFICR